MRHPDGELLLLARQGNQRAAKELVERYATPLFGYIMRLTGQRETAEDIFQDTFTRVFQDNSRYSEQGNFKAWLFRIAHNQIVDLIKKRRIDTVNVEPELLTNKQPDTLEQMVRTEQQKRMLELVERLPLKQKTVLLMRLEGKLSFKEIAVALNCSINTVIARMHYAVKKLREELNHD